MMHTKLGTLAPLALLALGAVASAACRLGGPADELTINSAVTPDPDGGSGTTGGGDTVGGSTTGGSSTGTGTTGGATTGGGSSGDAGSDATLTDSGGNPPDTGVVDPGPCVPPGAAPSGCDPVCNTGCATLSRCDIADTANTGRCIGIWISKEGEFCVKTASTNPCAPQLACENNACIHMCYNDSDCASAVGKCCKVDLQTGGGSSGFKGCAACTP